jgi:hypothetical protein
MSFKPSGEFLKNGANDAICAGTYKVSKAAVSMQTNCATQEERHVINNINSTSMIVEGDDNKMYKYDKQ